MHRLTASARHDQRFISCVGPLVDGVPRYSVSHRHGHHHLYSQFVDLLDIKHLGEAAAVAVLNAIMCQTVA